jgi:tetratricopeptide (TPR) repeat protein
VPEIEKAAPSLIRQHASEVGLILPTLRRRISIENRTLTDIASPNEKVRNYPMDRAYRLVHGLIDLLDSWQAHAALPGWVIVCENFADSGDLVQFFFRELMRRRGASLNLTLVLAGPIGSSPVGTFWREIETVMVTASLPGDPEHETDRHENTILAKKLEEVANTNRLEREERLPDLIHHWQLSENPTRAIFWRCLALAQAHHCGFYVDALRYGLSVLGDIEYICEVEKMFPRWTVVGTIVECYLALGKPELALELSLSQGIEKTNDPATIVRISYVLALIYARFLSVPDFEKADAFVTKGLEALEQADIEDNDRHFLKVFTLNGLAFVRHRQGRPEEALELCKSGFALLQEQLRPDQHRLHRSVLLYNMAQVYAAMSLYDEALVNYGAAIEFDPNYSEYYNERGNIYLKIGRLPEAIIDYETAIRLSAPYHEVLINMGQAYKVLGSYDNAVEAYSKALDLNPDQVLPLLGRAQAHEALGRVEEAIVDYTEALKLDPNQPLALANRATLHYEAGRSEEAARDLDRALELDPGNPDLYQNRAIALSAAGRNEEANCDFLAYLKLRPDAEDREVVQAQILEFNRSDTLGADAVV